MLDPIILIGGFGSHWTDYRGMGKLLAKVSQRRVFIANINRLSWAVGGITDYSLLVERAHKAVMHALKETGAMRVMIVGHSAGGLVGRAYLGDKAILPNREAYYGHERVSHLITLGSPLRAAPLAKHPGMAQVIWLEEHYPGAYYRHAVQYLTVSGKRIEGKRDGTLREREAFANYTFVSNQGEQWGDGVVPTSLTRFDDAPHLEIEDLGHSPNWGRWFGNDEGSIRQWWHVLSAGDFAPLHSFAPMNA